MTKQPIIITDQIKQAEYIVAKYKNLIDQIECERLIHNNFINAYKLDLNIETALHILLDHTNHLVGDINNALHDSSLEHIITEFHKPSGVDYLPDSLADPDRNTYGD